MGHGVSIVGPYSPVDETVKANGDYARHEPPSSSPLDSETAEMETGASAFRPADTTSTLSFMPSFPGEDVLSAISREPGHLACQSCRTLKAKCDGKEGDYHHWTCK